jgi:hypothetical protein
MMNLKWVRMMILILTIGTVLVFLTACSEFALLASGSSVALSQNSYAKMYNGVDVLTIITTEKSLKGHAYDSAKQALEGAKEGKDYIYDKTWGLTDK